jgi:hypothetical protein
MFAALSNHVTEEEIEKSYYKHDEIYYMPFLEG